MDRFELQTREGWSCDAGVAGAMKMSVEPLVLLVLLGHGWGGEDPEKLVGGPRVSEVRR